MQNISFGKSQAARWVWRMDYCKRNRMPPAEQWDWDRATRAYEREANKDAYKDNGQRISEVWLDELS